MDIGVCVGDVVGDGCGGGTRRCGGGRIQMGHRGKKNHHDGGGGHAI